VEQRCFHPTNFRISWNIQKRINFSVTNGETIDPFDSDEKFAPNLKFECHDCGFTAYYNPRNAPHWLEGKLKEAGAGFPA